jgi:hypothetical protein
MLRTRRPAARVRQSGQALLIAMGLLLAGGALLMAMFSAGQVAVAKQRLVGAADAAAWSTGLWRARVLNYHAYANRAIVANEVAIAQAVTLLAWSAYFESLTRNATAFSTLLPAAEPVLVGVAEAARLAREAAEGAARIEVAARGAEAIGYGAMLRHSQEILQLSAQGFGANMVAAEIARANDRSYFAWVLPDASRDWQRFTHRTESPDALRRVADLVRASLDPFTAGPRSEDIRTPIPSPCLNLMRLRKRGTTTWSEDLSRWEAVDTMSFHLRTLRGLRCRETEAVPLGWGAAEAGPAAGTITSTGGEIGINPSANALASAGMVGLPGYGGFGPVRELDLDVLENDRFPTTRLAVLARQPGEAVATAMARGLASGRMLPPDRFAGDGSPHLWALSAAEVYFRRPVDAPERVEYASLFNPFWQVRLAAPTAADRAVALGYAR